jgi:hypothetical protein
MAISGALSDANLVKMNNAKIQLDILGTGVTWANIESWANEVTPSRGVIPTSEDPTLDGESHLSVGTQEASEVKCVILYDEAAGGPATNLYTLLGGNVDIRWSKTGASGDMRYYTDGGKLIACSPPAFSSTENTNAKVEFTIRTATDINRETMVGTT